MPNNPYLDASVAWRIKSGNLDLHEAGYQTTKQAILSNGLATEVSGLVSSGKEADVYLALYRGAPLAVKVYRLYRTSHRGGRPIKLDSIGWMAAREFEMTRQAWKGGACVPAPARRVENMFSMRYIGTEDGPAPRLHDVHLDDPKTFLEMVLGGIKTLAQAGVVHADLSAFNVLVHENKPWFIDFSEAFRVDRKGMSPWKRVEMARAALEAGVKALQAYFAKYGIHVESEGFIADLVESLSSNLH